MPKKDGMADLRARSKKVGHKLAVLALKECSNNSLWAKMALQDGLSVIVAQELQKQEIQKKETQNGDYNKE